MQQRVTPKFLSKSIGRKRLSTTMPRLPQCHIGNQQVDYQNIYQVNQYDTPQVFIASAPKSIKVSNPLKTKSQRENSIYHHKIEGETPYDPTILTKSTIHQDRAKSRTRERD